MTVNEIAILVLVVSVSFSIAGISLQIMRLLSTSNETLKKTQSIVDNLVKLSNKVTDDYSQLSSHLLTLTGALSRIGTDIIAPIIGLFSFLDKFRKDE